MEHPAGKGRESRGVLVTAAFVFTFLFSGAPLLAQDAPITPPPVVDDTRIDLNETDAPLADVLKKIADRAGVNIVLAPGIDETVSVELKGVAWRLALQVVAERANCTIVDQAANLIRVEQPIPVEFNFQGADVKSVIDAIANLSGASIVVGPRVEGEVYLRVKDVPWRAALETVAKTMGAVVIEEGYGIFRVVHPDSLQAQLESRIFPIRYLRPAPNYRPVIESPYAQREQETAAAGGGEDGDDFSLVRALRSALSPAGKLSYFRRNNTVLVKDIPPVLDEIDRMIKELDVEPAQVFIDVKFVTTSNSDALNYGIDIGEQGLQASIGGGSIPTRLPFTLGGGGIFNDISAAANGQTPGLDPTQTADAITFGTLDFTGTTFALELLEQDDDSRIVQAPKLLALDNQEATIFVGRTIRFAETQAGSNQNGGLTFSIQEAENSPVQTGFQLYMVPHVIPGTNKVMMTVIPEAEQLVGTSSDPQLAGFQIFTSGTGQSQVSIALPQVAASTLVTRLLLESGQTAVIGGLITEQETETTRKVPVLGDIPVLGWFFSSKRKSYTNEALLIFITPRILRDSAGYRAFLEAENERRHSEIEAEMESIFGVGDAPPSWKEEDEHDGEGHEEEVEEEEEVIEEEPPAASSNAKPAKKTSVAPDPNGGI